MRKIQVSLLLVYLSSKLFVNCSVNDLVIEEISQFSWDLFKYMAFETNPLFDDDDTIKNNNIVMNGFGPQLLLLEAMLGAKDKTRQEIKDTAKSSAHSFLTQYYEDLKSTPRMKDLKIRMGNFATSQAKFHDTFLNEMFERNVEFRTTDFKNQAQTNKLMEIFYKNINYKHEDDYSRTTQMVMKSSTSLDFHMNCHFVSNDKFSNDEGHPYTVPTAKLFDNIKGGSIENQKGTVIAEWAEVPTEYMIDNDISIIFVKPIGKLTVNEVLPQIKDLKFTNNSNKNYEFMKFPLLVMAHVDSLNHHLEKMGISSMFSEDNANFTGMTQVKDENEIFVNDFKQTTAINIDCNIVEPRSSNNENNGFILNSPFFYIIYDRTRHIPLLIGKLADPLSAKPDSDKQTQCKLPVVENGYIWDVVYETDISSFGTIEVGTKVLVKCNSNYDLLQAERTSLRTCKSDGWDGQFPTCQKMCQLNVLRSHSAVITCEKDGTPISCSRSVAPKITATVKCNSRYNFEPNAQKTFVCQENGQWNGARTECKADCGQIVAKAEAAAAYAREADPHEIPWHATIYHKDNQICGGTIISELIIISAAHCFRTDLSVGVSEIVKSEFKIIVGKFYRNISATEPDKTQSLDVVDIQIPDIYEGKEMKFQGDFAVVTVNEVIVYGNHIAPACLNINAEGMDQQLPEDKQLGIVAGFGLTEHGKPSEQLKKIELPYKNYIGCRNTAPPDYRPFLVGDKFCAGFTDGTGYVCKGDSGGGLVFSFDKTKKYHLLGIVSNTRSVGEDKCDPHFYSLYTNIYSYLHIIKKEHTKSLLKLRDMIEDPKTVGSTSKI